MGWARESQGGSVMLPWDQKGKPQRRPQFFYVFLHFFLLSNLFFWRSGYPCLTAISTSSLYIQFFNISMQSDHINIFFTIFSYKKTDHIQGLQERNAVWKPSSMSLKTSKQTARDPLKRPGSFACVFFQFALLLTLFSESVDPSVLQVADFREEVQRSMKKSEEAEESGGWERRVGVDGIVFFFFLFSLFWCISCFWCFYYDFPKTALWFLFWV